MGIVIEIELLVEGGDRISSTYVGYELCKSIRSVGSNMGGRTLGIPIELQQWKRRLIKVDLI